MLMRLALVPIAEAEAEAEVLAEEANRGDTKPPGGLIYMLKKYSIDTWRTTGRTRGTQYSVNVSGTIIVPR